MKKLVSGKRATPVAASFMLMVSATLGVVFWFATGPASNAQSNCTLCHKRTQTLTLPCGSLVYNGHLGHGDTIGQCAVTPVENP